MDLALRFTQCATTGYVLHGAQLQVRMEGNDIALNWHAPVCMGVVSPHNAVYKVQASQHK